MSNYRGLIWSLVAIAGTATAATLAYRYTTRGTHSHGDGDNRSEHENSATTRSTDRPSGAASDNASDVRTNATDGHRDDNDVYESLSESEYDNAFDLDDDDGDATELATAQQQLVLVAREGNLLLSVFGVVLMLLVASVSLIITYASDDVPSPADLPMFAPLMWIAVGIFTAASVEVLSQSALTTPSVPVVAVVDEQPKRVFPHDESDFALIQQHNGESLAAPPTHSNAPATATQSPALVELLTTVDRLTVSEQHSDARALLLAKLVEYADNVDVLWRLARATYSIAEETQDAEEKHALVVEGLTHAERAFAVAPDSAASNLWMAILTSSMGNYKDLKHKIAGAYVIRDHTQRSIELNPLDPTPHHIMGNWALAFADMSWIEKKAAAALFGTPPTATYDDVVTHLLAAERLNPGNWKKNAFLLAETYLKMKRPSDAVQWVIVARAAPQLTKDDRETHERVLTLMKKLKM